MPIVFAPETLPLSKRQRQLCDVIESLTRTKGYAPTLREIAVSMGVHPTRVNQLIRTTEAKGAVCRAPRIARSVRVIRRPSDK